ncbi:ABC transporter permease [Pendulispora albinea]|uniref:ABC transporter permease n=1 Tax=Pendulispora albinea TaxID=2741071 RepID=A0ABZ2M0T1_9BACT
MSQSSLRARLPALAHLERLGPASLRRLLAVTLGVLVVFSLASPDVFFTPLNFRLMAFALPEVTILSLAVMLSMLTGGIDLSVVSIANLAALAAASVLTGGEGGPARMLEAVLAALLTGLACGAANGALVTALRITPILATLGTMQLLNGIAIVLTGGKPVTALPDSFTELGNGVLLGVPIPFVLLAVVALLIALLVHRTSLGLRMTLVGANPDAARFSGVKNTRVLVGTYTLSGALGAIAGLVICARTASASPDYGASYVLLSIVVAVFAGVNPNGGYATVGGVVLSATCLQMLSSGLNILRFSPFVVLMAQGAILIGVMALNRWSERRG